eukprot:gene6-330_t
MWNKKNRIQISPVLLRTIRKQGRGVPLSTPVPSKPPRLDPSPRGRKVV